MATRKNYITKPKSHHLNFEMFEFDESNFFNSNRHQDPYPSSSPDQFKKPTPTSRNSKKSSSTINGAEKIQKKINRVDGTAKSLPVNVPDWSKILREDRRDNNRTILNIDEDDDEDEDGGNEIIPPHEFLARQLGRTKISSFSVHEGIGRTLKGRDLSRVRDAIWEKIGFED